jgi:hypothetical protein
MEAMGAPKLRPFSVQAQRVCKRAHAGLLRARAERFCTDNQVRENVEVQEAFWWAEGHEALEQDWESGDFETWIDHTVNLRAFGVQWSRTDVQNMGVDLGPPYGDCFVELASLDPPDREAGERWASARYIRWFDAAVWVGARDANASASLAGFRAYETRTRNDVETSDGAAELVGISLVSEGSVARGKTLLADALRAGAITAFGSTTPDGSMEPIPTLEWARPFGVHKRKGADCLTGPEFPWTIRFFDLLLDAGAVFGQWQPPSGVLATADQSSVPIESPAARATKHEVRTWVIAQIRAGKTQTDVERQFRKAVPGKVVTLNRDAVRDLYDVEFRRLTGKPLRSGPRG